MSIIFKKAGLNKIIFNNCPDSTANLTIDNMLLFLNGAKNYQNETHAVYWDGTRWVYDEIGIREIASTFSNAEYPWLVEGFGIKTCVNNNKIKFLKPKSSCDTIFVSSAGTTSLNGTYTPAGTVTSEGGTFTYFTKDGQDSYPKIIPVRLFNQNWWWYTYTSLSSNEYIGKGPNGSFFTPENPINCPSDAIWEIQNGQAPVPNVTTLPPV